MLLTSFPNNFHSERSFLTAIQENSKLRIQKEIWILVDYREYPELNFSFVVLSNKSIPIFVSNWIGYCQLGTVCCCRYSQKCKKSFRYIYLNSKFQTDYSFFKVNLPNTGLISRITKRLIRFSPRVWIIPCSSNVSWSRNEMFSFAYWSFRVFEWLFQENSSPYGSAWIQKINEMKVNKKSWNILWVGKTTPW